MWCHHALGIEAVLDRSDALGAPTNRRGPVMGGARLDIAVADRLRQASADVAHPAGWAELAGQAAAVRNEAQRLVMARTAIHRLTVGQNA